VLFAANRLRRHVFENVRSGAPSLSAGFGGDGSMFAVPANTVRSKNLLFRHRGIIIEFVC